MERAEANQLAQALDPGKIGLLIGTAGGGKNSVLEKAATLLESTGAEILALRLDRSGHFASTADLGRQFGIETSLVVAPTRAADDRAAYLVTNQLDAVSLVSGRIPECFKVVTDLIGEVLSVGNMRVALACRQFDIDNDYRIRALASRADVITVEAGPLAKKDVESAVIKMGLDPTHLSLSQRVPLQTSLHLVFLGTISSEADALAFQSRGSLFEVFWERKGQTARVHR